MAWTISISPPAERQLAKLDKQTAKRIKAFLSDRVAPLNDPRDIGQVLRGPLRDFWRYRVGDYRVLCDIRFQLIEIHVIEIDHRSRVYR